MRTSGVDEGGSLGEAPLPPGASVHDEEVDLWARLGRHDTVRVSRTSPLVRSLGRDFKRLKDDELSAMMLVTADELLHVRQLLELEPLGSNELAAIPPIMRRATPSIRLS